MRILHLLNKLTDKGNGIVNVAVDLAMQQARQGHEVFFGSETGGYTPLLQAGGVQCLNAPQSGARRVLWNSWKLLRTLRKVRPDVIHTHMRSGLLLVWPWAKLLRVPVVMHLHNVHDRDYGLPRLPDRVIAVSQSVANNLISGGVPASRVRLVLNGVLGSGRLGTLPEKALLQRPAILTVAGMETDRKGIPELIEAFNLLPETEPPAYLHIVGDGEQFKRFKALAAASPAGNRIDLLGFQADPRPFLYACDLFALPSRRESFGLAILEARAAGCAILASDVDGIPELLENGRCGVLTPPRDSVLLAKQMERLLGDPELRKQLGRQAQQGLEKFTVAHMTQQVMDVYAEIAHRRGAKAGRENV